jgi:putrescine transport system ATP-binding protein
LAKAPKLLLLDEPLGALDKKLRQDTQFELMDIQEKTGTTFVIVTHDQEEAMTVASRVAVMDEGRIIQVATPDAIYEAPNSIYVADFIGDVNLIKGTAELRVSSKPAEQTTPETIEAPADPFVDDTPRPQPNKLGEWLHDKVLSPIIGERDKPIKRLPPPSAAELTATPEVTSDIPEGGIALNWSDQHPAIIVSNGDEAQDGKALTFAIRPEKLNIAKDKPDAANALQGTVIDIAYLGNVSTYHVELKGGQMIKAQMANARRLAKRDITWEDTVWVSFTDTAGVLLER